MKIIVDPEDNIQYMSFYLSGLLTLFGQERVVFNHQAFRELPKEDRNTRSMRFILRQGFSEKRFVIDTNDSYEINDTLYKWCDTYGSVNANFSKTPRIYQQKLISLCPSFDIRYTSYLNSCFWAVKGVISTSRDKRKYLGCWRRMLQRPTLEEYRYCPPRDNYIFHLSTLWQNDELNRNDQGVNLRRATFIRACQSMAPEISFEGGLVAFRKEVSTELFSDCIAARIPGHIWLQKTKESAVVFNTPAYWDCHGWKLGEYMALGKAIISTKLSNDLPAPLLHGEHIHIVECSQEELKEAIRFILNHPHYRQQLERNVLAYWQKYGTPEASLMLLGLLEKR